MIQFSDQEMANKRLVLDSKTELYYLGHELTLRNCTLVLKIPARALVIARTQIIDCTIEVKQELKGFRWLGAVLRGCRFTGRLRGNDFGRAPEHVQELLPGPPGSIEGCDFTGAQLHACRFLACDVRTLRFPPWPCFTIFDPVQRWRELSTLSWPGDIGRIEIKSFAESPPSTVALTLSALEVAKRSGTTPEAIKAVLEQLDGVHY